MTKIDIEQIKADRDAGSKGSWGRGWDDGQIVVITQGEFEGDDVVSDPMLLQADQNRIARVPDMEDVLIEAVELLGSLRIAVEDSGFALDVETFLERFK